MKDFKIIVTGKYACFTMPQFKTERVSYDYPTPSAMKGLIESIYYKPAIRIVIDKIVVFNPIKHLNIKRREFDNIPSIYGGSKQNAETSIRNTLLLQDVKYGIQFHIELTHHKSENKDECLPKHYGIMEKRLKRGQSSRQPYLGCREFSVGRIELVDDFDLSEVDNSLMCDFNIGYMLYGLDFEDKGIPINGDWNNPIFSNSAKPMWYSPRITNGVIDVAKYRGTIIC